MEDIVGIQEGEIVDKPRTINDLKTPDQPVNSREGDWEKYTYLDGEAIRVRRFPMNNPNPDQDQVKAQFLSPNGEIVAETKHNTTNRNLDAKEFADKFLKAENFDGVLLDVGCGSEANFVKSLRSEGINAFGIDILIPQKQYRNKELEDYTAFGSASRTGLKDSSVDAITLSRVFYPPLPVETARKMMAEFSRILKPSGQIYILPMAPGYQDWYDKVFEGQGYQLEDIVYDNFDSFRLKKTG